MKLRTLLTVALAMGTLALTTGCEEFGSDQIETDKISNLAVTEFDLSPYCGEGTELNEAETLCVPSAAACGEETELNADGTQCVPVYDCFRGGYCAKLAEEGYTFEKYGNIYAGHTKDKCTNQRSAYDEVAWKIGWELTDYAILGSDQMPPLLGSYLCSI